MREIALVENKIARLARRSMDEEPAHPASRARRLSPWNPRTVAQGPPCKLRSIPVNTSDFSDHSCLHYSNSLSYKNNEKEVIQTPLLIRT